MKNQLAGLPNQLRNAIMRKDWRGVKELSDLEKKLKHELENKEIVEEFCRKVYEPHDVTIDPFSPGMHTLSGISMSRLKQLHDHAMKSLQQLAGLDSEWKDFYLNRLAVLQSLIIQDGALSEETQFVPEVVLEEEAEQALESGNMDRLGQLAEKIIASNEKQGEAPNSEQLLADKHQHPDDFLYPFSDEVVKRAAEFGLGHYTVPSSSKDYAPLARFAWHPTFSNVEDRAPHVLQVPDIPFAENTPEAMKTRIQLFAIHPFINSCGVRYLPHMVAENVLVEDFPDPDPASVPTMPAGKLLHALGLPQRNYLDRNEIESHLFAHGNDFLQHELGLDPLEFKLVCIPPDLHLRIGQQQGWGQQKIWTHFDGYMLMEGAVRKALVGGDVRYGGIYDLLGIGNDYSSERIVVRFAVVQRKRLAVWQ